MSYLNPKFLEKLQSEYKKRNKGKIYLYTIKKNILDSLFVNGILKMDLKTKMKFQYGDKELFLNSNNHYRGEKMIFNITLFYFEVLNKKVNYKKINFEIIYDYKSESFEEISLGSKILINSFLLNFLKNNNIIKGFLDLGLENSYKKLISPLNINFFINIDKRLNSQLKNSNFINKTIIFYKISKNFVKKSIFQLISR